MGYAVPTHFGRHADDVGGLHRLERHKSRAELIQATNGNLHGTTYLGGKHGGGTAFNYTKKGTLSFLPTQAYPDSALIQATNGNLYGTSDGQFPQVGGYGMIFYITPSNTITILHTFDGTDGWLPIGLIQAADGNLYGTTAWGGANTQILPEDDGTIFKITLDGTLTTLYNFCSETDCADGEEPVGLVRATNGSLFGTSLLGGAFSAGANLGDGTVFEITP